MAGSLSIRFRTLGWTVPLVGALALFGCGSSGPGTGTSDGSVAADGSTADDGGMETDASGSGTADAASSDPDGGPQDAATGGDGSAECIALGKHCREEVSCCEGFCDPEGSLCVHGAGGSCDPEAINPDAYCAHGTYCNTDEGVCERLECIRDKEELVCDSFSGLSCCHEKEECTQVGEGDSAFYECCIPDGTIVSEELASRCCSPATETVDETRVRCVDPDSF